MDLPSIISYAPLCFQINSREEPYNFDRGIVSQQIRVLQIFETLQLLQSGTLNPISQLKGYVNRGILSVGTSELS